MKTERPTPETERIKGALHTNWDDLLAHARKLERERDEARDALRQIWQFDDAFLPYIEKETINRWRKAAGWEETK